MPRAPTDVPACYAMVQPGLEEIVRRNVAEERLSFTTDLPTWRDRVRRLADVGYSTVLMPDVPQWQPARVAVVIKRVKILEFDWVSDGDDLCVLVSEQFPDVALALTSTAYDGHIDLFAGRDELRPSQHVTRNDGNSGHGGSRRTEKGAAGEAGLG